MRPLSTTTTTILLLLAATHGAAAETLFNPARVVPLDPYPYILAVGDVTGDGRDDVVTGTSQSTCSDPSTCRLLVLPQTPFGTLTGPFALPTWPASAVALGDFNGDGRNDVAFAGGGELSLYPQDPAGTLLPPVVHGATYGVHSLFRGDLNGDGRLDLATGGGYSLELFLQTPAGGLRLETMEFVDQIGHPHAVVDLDGDGRDDFLFFGGGQPRLTFLYQRPGGGFTPPVSLPMEPGTHPQAAAVGDFDGDGLPEIVVATVDHARPQPYRLQIVDQTAPRSWSPGIAMETGDVTALAVADLDGDGRDDVVALDREPVVAIWLQRQAGTLTLEHRYALPYGNYITPAGLALGDLNGDGLLDIGVASDNAGLVVLDRKNDQPPPPPGPWLLSSEMPGFELKVRITGGTATFAGSLEPECIPETVCVSGALPGRSEAFLRVVGPKPNGKLWPTLVKFSTSQVEVWMRQLGTNVLRYYRLAGARPGFDELPGLFDRQGFDPLGSKRASAAPATAPPPPAGPTFGSHHFPDYRFRARISSGDHTQEVRQEACIEETLCLSAAVPGRSEVFLRIVGPKPNGRMWPTIVKFTTSTLEVWIEHVSTGETKYYRIDGAAPGQDDLTGLFDRAGFAP